MGTCVAAEIDITIYEGGTFDRVFQWQTGSPAASVNITGYTGAGAVRARLADTSPLVSIPFKSSAWAEDADTGVYIHTAAEGKFRVYIKDTDTVGMCAANRDVSGVWDVFLTSPAGETVLKLHGVAEIKAAVKR